MVALHGDNIVPYRNSSGEMVFDTDDPCTVPYLSYGTITKF